MDSAMINMVTDLRFYYNLLYYLYYTKMDNNLKIILMIDVLKFTSMVSFEVNKFFKKEYNQEIVPLDIVNLTKNIRNQTKLYEKDGKSVKDYKVVVDYVKNLDKKIEKDNEMEM